MRAALLPAGPDPFLIAYWLRNYQTWAQYVDELRIVVCGQEDGAIRQYLNEIMAQVPRATVRFTPRTDHGQVIRELIEETAADTVMLCEDDAFIRHPDKLDEIFHRIEIGKADIVGSPRATGSQEILEWAKTRWGDWQVEPTGEAGPLLWPCFLFARRDALLQTDRCFGAWGRPAGELILGQAFETDQAMDTFGWTTLQLREAGRRIEVEPNYRAQRYALSHWTNAPWFHVGGLSVGYGLYFLDPQPEQLQAVRDDPYDWGKRISWWRRVAEKWDRALPEQLADYICATETYAAQIDSAGIAEWRKGFDGLITWNELT